MALRMFDVFSHLKSAVNATFCSAPRAARPRFVFGHDTISRRVKSGTVWIAETGLRVSTP
eukprot:3760127-Prymnesium_polylepis.1